MVPIEKWGKDHWSTFAYIETVCVDFKGIPDRRRVMCNPKRHPNLVGFMPMGGMLDGSKYPIRLFGGEEKFDYDEWDCIDDMEREGLLQNIGTSTNPKFRMTDYGYDVIRKLREHKSNGGRFASFKL